MQAPPDVTQTFDELPLHERVHVFIGAADESRLAATAFADIAQRRADGLRLVGGQHPGNRERVRPGQAALDIVLEELPVKRQRGLKPEDSLVY